MNGWQVFENECTEYLNENFGDCAVFTQKGKSDSTVPDILVSNHTGKCFYIEVKHSPAQSGQFVLIPDLSLKTFKYSELNTKPINKYAEAIIRHMNSSFDDFKNAGTQGKNIVFDNCKEVFAKWIINSYNNNNTKFIITNDFVIFPFDKFQDYFDVTAKYRVKKSGSTSVGKSRIITLKNHILSLEHPILKIYASDDKLFVSSTKELHNVRFTFQDREYMFSRGINDFEVRKLSKTFNANVIFSITKKKTMGLTKDQFKGELNKLL